MSNFDRGFFNNEDVSSSIKFAVLAILNRGSADEYNRGVGDNIPVIMANFPAGCGISSFAFDVGNESGSNGNLLIKVKENEYTTHSFDCVSIIENRVDDPTVLRDSINQILTAYREQLNNNAITEYVPALKEKLDKLNKFLKDKDLSNYFRYRESLEKFIDLAVQVYKQGQVKENAQQVKENAQQENVQQANETQSEGQSLDDSKKKQTMTEMQA